MRKHKITNRQGEPFQINSLADLQEEQRRLKAEVGLQESELRDMARALPRESLKAGIGNLLPSMISGKYAGAALGLGSVLFSLLLKKKIPESGAKQLTASLKQAGLLTLAQLALRYFMKKGAKN